MKIEKCFTFDVLRMKFFTLQRNAVHVRICTMRFFFAGIAPLTWLFMTFAFWFRLPSAFSCIIKVSGKVARVGYHILLSYEYCEHRSARNSSQIILKANLAVYDSVDFWHYNFELYSWYTRLKMRIPHCTNGGQDDTASC